MRRPALAFLGLLFLVNSCRNDLEIMAPYKEMPVVYCILNPKEPVQQLRLERSFMGEANAYDMARLEDSVYYPDAEVFLERWANGERKSSVKFEKSILADRDSGTFIESPNYVYQCASQLQGNSEYRLAIRIPSISDTISATTRVVSEFRVIRPESYKKTLAFSSYDNYQTVEWVSAPFTRIYQLTLRFHYLEVNKSDTIRKTADWNISTYVTEYGTGGQTITADILHRNFFKWLGNQLDKPTGSMIRLADKQALDFIFTVGGEELYTYLEIYGESSGIAQEKPVFTNIVNGIGIFSSRFQQSIIGKALTESSIDSISKGMYTSHLGFDDSRNDYYHTGK
jgi:hypothetical protein